MKKNLYLPIVTGGLTFLALIIHPGDWERLLNIFLTIIMQGAPWILLFYALVFIVDILLTPEQRKKILQHKGEDRWYLAMLSGIFGREAEEDDHFSTGIKRTYLVCLIIQLPVLPFLIKYFGLLWSGFFALLVVVAAILQGKIIEWINRTIN